MWCYSCGAEIWCIPPSSLTKLADLPYLHLQVILVPLHLQELLTRQFCPASATRIAPTYIYIQTRGNTLAMTCSTCCSASKTFVNKPCKIFFIPSCIAVKLHRAVYNPQTPSKPLVKSSVNAFSCRAHEKGRAGQPPTNSIPLRSPMHQLSDTGAFSVLERFLCTLDI